jgi:hypothetical protein
MNLISLGGSCVTKFQITNYKNINNMNDKETNLFDWVISIFQNILDILSTDNINNIFNIDNIIHYELNGEECRIGFKPLDYFLSIHDLPNSYTDSDLHEFINKYKRRYERMINIIKNDNNIIFLRFDNDDLINIEDYLQFKNIIQNINPNCKFCFINLIINLQLEDNINIINENYYKINLKNYLIFEKVDITGGSFNCFDWKTIFNDIEDEMKNINFL